MRAHSAVLVAVVHQLFKRLIVLRSTGEISSIGQSLICNRARTKGQVLSSGNTYVDCVLG